MSYFLTNRWFSTDFFICNLQTNKIEYRIDIVSTCLNFNSKHLDKCTFVVILTSLVTTSNLFLLEVVQLCVLQENSTEFTEHLFYISEETETLPKSMTNFCTKAQNSHISATVLLLDLIRRLENTVAVRIPALHTHAPICYNEDA